MSLPVLREQVCQANRDLVAAGLVALSFGNASGVDRDAGVLAIKPSGVAYATLRPEDIVLVDLADGRVVEGALRPSSDTPTHLVLYRRFPAIGGVVHTHSSFAAAWAQAGRPIPCLGTTHADHFAGAVPVTRALTDGEIAGEYEQRDGRGDRRDDRRPGPRSAPHAGRARRVARPVHLGHGCGRRGRERDRPRDRRRDGASHARDRPRTSPRSRLAPPPALRPQARTGRVLRPANG